MEDQTNDTQSQTICGLLDDMTSSMASVRSSIQTLREKHATTEELDTKDGISLLSLKHHLLLSYLNSLVLVSARHAIGDSLSERSLPSLPFSSAQRDQRGSGAGDLVDSMIEGRVALEKIKVLESRMRYQIEKLVRLSSEQSSKDLANDPLAFKPNPQNLIDEEDADEDEYADDADKDQDGIYRPPKLAPMPYVEPTSKRSDRKPVPKALSSLIYSQDPSRPFVESSSGLGALQSDRRRELDRMREYEEENFTRLVMKKKDAKKRARDEANVALGGGAQGNSRRRGRGLEDEFADVLTAVGRTRTGVLGDGYEELRQRGRKTDVLSRARTRPREEIGGAEDDGPIARKKTRFEKQRVALSKRARAKRP